MKKTILVALLLAGCAHRPVAPAEVLPATEIITNDRAVPIPCSEIVKMVPVDSDGLDVSQITEEKAYRILRSDSQHRINEAALKAAAIKCGVKVID